MQNKGSQEFINTVSKLTKDEDYRDVLNQLGRRWILLNVDSGYPHGGKYSQPMFRNLWYVYYYIKVIFQYKKE